MLPRWLEQPSALPWTPIRAPAPTLSPPIQEPEGSFRNPSPTMPLLYSKPSSGSPFHSKSKSKFFNGTRSCIINSSLRPLPALAPSISATDAMPVGLCTGCSPACLALPPHTHLAISHGGVQPPPRVSLPTGSRASIAPSVCLWRLHRPDSYTTPPSQPNNEAQVRAGASPWSRGHSREGWLGKASESRVRENKEQAGILLRGTWGHFRHQE